MKKYSFFFYISNLSSREPDDFPLPVPLFTSLMLINAPLLNHTAIYHANGCANQNGQKIYKIFGHGLIISIEVIICRGIENKILLMMPKIDFLN